MKQIYIDLFNLNRDLINGYRIRCTNHEELMKNLRYLNQMVQKATNLRSKLFQDDFLQIKKKIIYLFCFLFLVGKYSKITMNQCRTAIKGNNIQLLIKSIKTGNV